MTSPSLALAHDLVPHPALLSARRKPRKGMPEVSMKTPSAFATAVLLMLSSVGAGAQEPILPTQPKVNLTLEQRHVIKEIVKDLKLQPAPADTDISIGATLPQTVKLEAIPGDIAAKVPQIKSHQFFVKDNKVVLVEPKDHKVAEVIE
jgi:hypothetical protein